MQDKNLIQSMDLSMFHFISAQLSHRKHLLISTLNMNMLEEALPLEQLSKNALLLAKMANSLLPFLLDAQLWLASFTHFPRILTLLSPMMSTEAQTDT